MAFSAQSTYALQPTLWRTCRALANKTRLQLLHELFVNGEQTVSDIAARAKIRLSLASLYLRTLNARGILSARASGRWTFYQIQANKSVPHAQPLVSALLASFQSSAHPVDELFRDLTGCTHPRRLALLQALKQPLSLDEMRSRTGIPFSSLLRHLHKLLRRGYVLREGKLYRCAPPRSPMAKCLLKLATAESPTRGP